MRINSVPDVRCFCNNKNVLCVKSSGMTFRAPPCIKMDLQKVGWGAWTGLIWLKIGTVNAVMNLRVL